MVLDVGSFGKKRCAFVTQGQLSSEAVISHTITMTKNIRDVKLVAHVGERVIQSATLVGWMSPSHGVLKLNTDASLELISGRAYGGGLIRDDACN